MAVVSSVGLLKKKKFKKVSSAVLCHPLDPSDVLSDLGVDAGVESIGAADAPRYNALKFTITNQRSS